jgi:hypothetical protein
MKVDEFYKEWSGKHHTTNSCIPVHDSAECCDFAEQFAKQLINENEFLAKDRKRLLKIVYRNEVGW